MIPFTTAAEVGEDAKPTFQVFEVVLRPIKGTPFSIWTLSPEALKLMEEAKAQIERALYGS